MIKKNYLSITCIVCICVFIFFNCSKKDENYPDLLEDGILQLSINTSRSDKMIINTLRSVPVNFYRVIIMTSENIVFAEYEHYEDIPSEITLAADEYYIIAHSDNDSSAAFENPYFYGQSGIFTIGTSKITQINVECEIENFAVSINYTNDVSNNFIDYFTVVKNSDDSLIFINNETKTGYFNIQPVTIYSVLTYELADGGTTQKIIEGEISNPIAGNLYSITIDASYNNMQTGIQIGLTENLDTNFVEINDYINCNDLLQGDLLITEIMYDPSALSDTDGEWFEIYNNTPSPVNIQNLVLRNGSNNYIVNEKIILQSGSYFGFARTDTAFAGEKHVYSGIALTNTTDDLSLFTYGTNGTDGNIIATVTYDEGNGFPVASGESINLCINHFNFNEAQLADSWCLSADTFNTGDYGTPGLTNISCD